MDSSKPPPSTERSTGTQGGELAAAVSRTLVQLYKECYGKGPTKARTHIGDDLIVCVLEGGFVKAERTLVGAGLGEVVADQRGAFQDTMRESFVRAVEQVSGRTVISFMSGVDVETEMNSELFVLKPLEPVPDMGDEREALGAWAEQTRRQARDLRDETVQLREQGADRRRGRGPADPR
jgi:uncharacterized protein YbcI